MTDSKDDKPKYTVEIAPGAFDNFEGTQEELDEIIAEFTRLAESGEILEMGEPIDMEELFLEDPEMAMRLAEDLGLFDEILEEIGDDPDFEEVRERMRQERQRRMN